MYGADTGLFGLSPSALSDLEVPAAYLREGAEQIADTRADNVWLKREGKYACLKIQQTVQEMELCACKGSYITANRLRT